MSGSDLSDREKVALQFTELLVTTPAAISDGLFGELRRHFSPAEILEIAYFVMYSNFSHRISAALQSDPPEGGRLRILSAAESYGIQVPDASRAPTHAKV